MGTLGLGEAMRADSEGVVTLLLAVFAPCVMVEVAENVGSLFAVGATMVVKTMAFNFFESAACCVVSWMLLDKSAHT